MRQTFSATNPGAGLLFFDNFGPFRLILGHFAGLPYFDHLTLQFWSIQTPKWQPCKVAQNVGHMCLFTNPPRNYNNANAGSSVPSLKRIDYTKIAICKQTLDFINFALMLLTLMVLFRCCHMNTLCLNQKLDDDDDIDRVVFVTYYLFSLPLSLSLSFSASSLK